MRLQLFSSIAVFALCISFAGCKKKAPVAAKPMTPAPTVSQAAPVPSTPAPAPAARPAEVASTTPSRMPDAATRVRIQELLDRIQDAYFDYNKHTIRPDAEVALKQDAQTLSDIIRQYPDFKLTVEGHTDERGSDQYNLGLGEARAKQALDYMVSLGLPGNQLRTISYGKEKPICTEHDEDCWQKNRRAHITQSQNQSPQ
jgi:peptidoglycan-associated lipoprotein